MTDISDIQSNHSFLDLLFPGTQDELGLRFEVLPPDSPAIKVYTQKERTKQMQLARKGRIASAADEERISKELCAIAVVGWEFTKKDAAWNGAQPTFDRIILQDMLSRDWLRGQVDDHLGDIKSFFLK